MRAVVATAPGGPDVLEVRDLPDPVIADGEVLIRVAATAIGPTPCSDRGCIPRRRAPPT